MTYKFKISTVNKQTLNYLFIYTYVIYIRLYLYFVLVRRSNIETCFMVTNVYLVTAFQTQEQ